VHTQKHPEKNIGYYLRVYRAKWDLTQRAAARQVGIGASMWTLLERGRRRPSVAVAQRLMRLTGVPISELVKSKS